MPRRFMFDCLVAVCGAVSALLACGVGAARAGDEVHEDQKLTASDAAAHDQFGWFVSVSGDTAVVGAPGDDCTAGDDCGSAYVYRFDGATWLEEQKLTASDAAEDDEFGHSVSVSGDTSVVGAWQDDCAAGDDCGSAYVFRFDGVAWVEQQKLTASDAAADDELGTSVSVSGGTAVVGAWKDDCAAGGRCGSAYVFRFDPKSSQWVEEQKLTASDAAGQAGFGHSVSLDGETAVVGAYWADCGAGYRCGSAYVFRFDPKTSQWTEEQKLTASDAAEGDGFGDSVSVSGDTAVVGAPGDRCWEGGLGCGSAYVYRFDGATWIEEQKLTVSDTWLRDWFGGSVSASGDTVVVGVGGDDCGPEGDCGSAYVYLFDGANWVETHKLTASDAAGLDLFGFSVSVSGDTGLVGARWADCAAGSNCGAAYVFFVALAPTESYPPSDSIDARQPSDLACTELFGWDSIDIIFNGDTVGVQAADFTVTVDPADVTPPAIVNVVPNGNTATLAFDTRIPPGHWTIITHDASGFVTRIGALPADVNGDRTSGPVDILDLIDFLNDVGSGLEIWQTDIDRSGEANSADILTQIDLLNGAGCFDGWNGETLPE